MTTMTTTLDIYGTVFKNGTCTLLARIVDSSGASLDPSAVASVVYSVYLLDDDDADRRTPVAGHEAVAVPVGDVLLEAPCVDALWSIDAIGYNFRHLLDVSAAAAFPTARRKYLVEYRLAPNGGQVVLLRFRVNAI